MVQILQVKSITAGYGTTMVIHDADIRLEAGGICALLGPNG